MTSRFIAFTLAAALLLPPCNLWAGEERKKMEAKPAGVARIELHPGSSVEIEAWDKCVTITNTLPNKTMLYVPVFFSDAWNDFIKTKRSHI